MSTFALCPFAMIKTGACAVMWVHILGMRVDCQRAGGTHSSCSDQLGSRATLLAYVIRCHDARDVHELRERVVAERSETSLRAVTRGSYHEEGAREALSLIVCRARQVFFVFNSELWCRSRLLRCDFRGACRRSQLPIHSIPALALSILGSGPILNSR